MTVDEIEKMNSLARRIYEGQSPDLYDKERFMRIKAGLAEQGFTDLKKLKLPFEINKAWI